MTKYAANWNMPGYLPMDPPGVFDGPGEAMEYIHAEIGDMLDTDVMEGDLTVGEAGRLFDELAHAKNLPARVGGLVAGLPVNVNVPHHGLVFWVQPIADGEETGELHG